MTAFIAAWRAVPGLAHEVPATTAFSRHRHAGDAGGAPTITAVPLDDVSPMLVCALVSAEDSRFFEHGGVEWRMTLTKAVRGLRTRTAVTGVSTITQQLARNLFLHPGRSYGRKLHEALLALRLEACLDKARLLELYLNVIEWGRGTWGVGAASRAWFGCEPRDLDAFQAVVLASMVPAPLRAFEGANARRALTAQRRMVLALYGSGCLRREGMGTVYGCIARLEGEVAAGRPFADAVREVARGAAGALASARVPVSMAALMRDDAGMRRHHQHLVFRWQARDDARWLAALPDVWTGEPPPRPLPNGA